MSQEKRQNVDSVSFYQIMIVILSLIIAVIIKTVGRDFYENLRLKYINIIGDKGGYNEIVYPADAIEERT